MTTSLAAIRAKLLEQQDSRSPNSQKSGSGDNTIFAHWNIPEGTNATVRFLPDSDPANTFFWVERQMIRLEFPGIKGGDERKAVTIQVPCVEMWGDKCPVHAEIRPWFKDPSLEDIARKYWKKRSYLFQGFVVNSDLDEEAPENPIRRFVINPQIFKVISSALMDPDFSELPTDYEGGTDFRITKSTKGQYADYSTSSWARRERSLDQEERDAIETHGLFNLQDFLPRRPTQEDLTAIFEMFEASVNGELYDVERWGNHYRPYGVDAPATATTKAPIKEKTAPANDDADDDSVPFDADPAPAAVSTAKSEPAKSDGAKPSAGDILAAIRNRKEG